MSAVMKLLLVAVCFFLETRAITTEDAGDSAKLRKRSDDAEPLQAVVDQLVQRLSAVEASEAALKSKVSSLEQRMATQEKKRCFSGEVSFAPHNQPTVKFPSGHTERTETHHVSFATPFDKIPAVTLGFTLLDAYEDQNLRVNTDLQNLSVSGFDLSVREWESSYNYGIHVRWMACPQ